MVDKKAQGMPMNVVILGIIVLVVLIVVLVFFVGGTTNITQKIRDIVTGRVGTQSVELSVEDCRQFCSSAEKLPNGDLQRDSAYCKKAFIVDLSGDGKLKKVGCGLNSKIDPLTGSERGRGIDEGGSLGVECTVTC